MLLREVHHDVQAVAIALSVWGSERGRFILDFHAVFLGEVTQRLHVAHPFMLHDEGYAIAALAATEIFKDAF